ncbi:MAG: thiol reductant ABC exporter subunit CydD, partial [Candidatus Dormibacteraeota bacterium]|nr:thiol reductant ABC exporter subunit CydD [Candidatus Dormibacteraeota bacterium]
LPLLPFFLYLVGAAAGTRARRRQRVLDDLGGHFLDVLRGLPTLRCFNRGQAQAARVAEIAEQYRRTTMSTLRLAFLSSLVLELAAMLSTALVAVEIGLRVDAGLLPLRYAFFVLMLVPEVFLPLRQAGLQFHAAADARAATDRVLALLELKAAAAGEAVLPQRAPPALRLDGVTVRHPDRAAPSLDRANLEVRPGERVALYGPSGGGKTTVLQVLLGLEPPAAGRVLLGGVDLREADPSSWRSLVAWLPQEARLAYGTVAENVRWGDPSACDEAVDRALREAGLPPESLPRGLSTPVGEGGRELSAGQRRRVALARALVRRARVLLLDEPGANLDVELQEQVGKVLDRLPRDTTVLYCVHQPGLLRHADRVVRVEAGTLR